MVKLGMRQAMEQAKLTIERGVSQRKLYELVCDELGDEAVWSNLVARNAIRHCLTNYEAQWARINYGRTGYIAYSILRQRVDRLIDKAYPQYAEGKPEVKLDGAIRNRPRRKLA